MTPAGATLTVMSFLGATLSTPRLWLEPSSAVLAAEALDFLRRNDAHLAPWDPPRPDDLYTLERQQRWLLDDIAALSAGSGCRWWLRARRTDGDDAAPGTSPLIGHLRFSQIARGPFQSAMLGYAVDHQAQGQGLMHEALAAAIAVMFGPAVHLHRIQANVRPDNTRSLRLLQRLGFEREGLAREYLYIDGAWRDHAMTALRNPAFDGPPIG